MKYIVMLYINDNEIHRAKGLSDDEYIAGVREDAVQYFEQHGDVEKMSIRQVVEPPPQQMTMRDAIAQNATPAPPPDKSQKPRRTRANAGKIPTLEEALDYALQRRAGGKGLTDQETTRWWNTMQSKGWLIGETQTPVQDWRAAFRTAELNRDTWDAAAPKKNQLTGYAPSFDLNAFEQSTLEIPVFGQQGGANK